MPLAQREFLQNARGFSARSEQLARIDTVRRRRYKRLTVKASFHGSRVIVALALALFVAVQLHSAVHRALVPHEVCAVDGTLAHAHDHAPPPDGDAREEGPRFDGPEARGEHAEHCAVVLLGRLKETLFPVEPDLRVVGASAVAPSRLRPSLPIARREALYLLAPKHSPPRAA
jgi:hypothetical protein